MTAPTRQSGFTLIEILIVIAIIGLLMMIVLPNVNKLFDAQAMVQARNQIDAQLKVARSLAIRDRKYTGVHFQRHRETRECWSAIVQASMDGALGRDPADTMPTPPPPSQLSDDRLAFRMVDGTQPARMPGRIGVGLVGGSLGDRYEFLGALSSRQGRTNMLPEEAFTTFTVLFDPDGRLVTGVGWIPFIRESAPNVFYCSLLFDSDPSNEDLTEIWALPPDAAMHPAAVCIFDDAAFDAMPLDGNDSLTPGTKEYFLNSNARFLPVGPYVGGLIQTATE